MSSFFDKIKEKVWTVIISLTLGAGGGMLSYERIGMANFRQELVDYVDKRVEQSTKVNTARINKIDNQLDKIDNKVDEILRYLRK